MSTIHIDLNVRYKGGTFAGFEQIEDGGVPMVDQVVRVIEPETRLGTKALVTAVDHDRRLVFLSLDWSTLAFDPPKRVGPAHLTHVKIISGMILKDWDLVDCMNATAGDASPRPASGEKAFGAEAPRTVVT